MKQKIRIQKTRKRLQALLKPRISPMDSDLCLMMQSGLTRLLLLLLMKLSTQKLIMI